MAKISKRSQGRGNAGAFEYQESYDDSLLPDATELSKLKLLDPEIIPWIKDRTEREQDLRHNFTFRRLSLMERDKKKRLSLTCFQ